MLLAGRLLLVVGEDEDLARAAAEAAAPQGAEVVACRGGREALARLEAGGVDGVLVDLPLADIRGDVFLVAMRDRGLPCVAVSGVLRGPRYELLARQFGALAYLEKPFRMEVALAAIEQALPETGAAPADEAAERVAVEAPEAGSLVDPSPTANATSTAIPTPTATPTAIPTSTPTPTATPTAIPTPTPTPTATATATAMPAATPSSVAPAIPVPTALSPFLSTPPAVAAPELELDGLADPDSVIYSRARPALDDTLPGVPLVPAPAQGLELPLPSVTPPPRALRPEAPALPEGSLEHTSVPKLLVALHAARATGALTLTCGAVKKVILLEGGIPVLAASNVPAERFGARCVAEGLLTREEQAELLAQLDPGASLGEALVARGRLTEAERARRVTEQAREIVWSTFRWRDGAYRLALGPLPRRGRVPIQLALGDLVLEGHRRASPLEVLRVELPERLALAPRTDGPFPRHELAFSPDEASLLSDADGTKTVRDLVLLSPLAERDALAFLQGCRELGLVDEVRRVLAGTRRIGFM